MRSVDARVSSPVLIGRLSQTEALHGAFLRAADGEARTVLLGGEAGVGKSRILAEFLGWVAQQGGRALLGGCLELAGSALPYAPIIEALRPVARRDQSLLAQLGSSAREIARILPELEASIGGPDSEAAPTVESQARLFEAILVLFERLSAVQPVVLAIEDAQWSDRSTRDLVGFLVQNLHTERVLVLLTYRTDRHDPDRSFERFLGQLEHSGRVDRVLLQPLAQDELRELVEAIQGSPPDMQVVQDIFDRSEGNPLFVEELLAAHSATPGSKLPTSLNDLLLARFVGLSPTAKLAAQVVSLAGRRRVSDLLLSRATGLSDDDLFSGLRDAVVNGVLEVSDDGEGYRFRHVLLGEAMASELLPGERRRLHARIAESLESAAGTSGVTQAMHLAELAWHWDQAGNVARALPAAIAAGHEAMRVAAFAEAAKHYGRALRLWPLVADAAQVAGLDEFDLEEKAAEAEYLAGEPARAADLTRIALAALDKAGDQSRAGRLQGVLGSYLLDAGDDSGAIEALRKAAALVPSQPPTRERVRIACSLAAALMLEGRYRESLASCEEALAMARLIEVPELESLALNFIGVDEVNLGDVELGLGHLRRSLEIAAEAELRVPRLEAYNNLAFMLDRADLLEEAVTVALEGVAAAGRMGLDRLTGAMLRATAGHALYRLGRWAEAETILSDGLRIDPQGDQAISLRKDRGRLRAGVGDFRGAATDLAAARERATRAHRADSLPGLAAAMAELAIWEGRISDARKAVSEGLGLLADTDEFLAIPALCALGLRIEADAARTARGGEARIAAERAGTNGLRLVEQARAVGTTPRSGELPASVRVEIALCEAELGRLEGTSTSEAWGETASSWEALAMPYPAAYARYREAEALLSQRESRTDAADRLLAARDMAEGLGARPLLEGIDAVARRARVDINAAAVRQRAEEEAPTAGKALGLTARETDVLALVAAGQTNRQIAAALFVAEKTVGVHMTNILGKLGVRNRFEAAAIGERAGIKPGEIASEGVQGDQIGSRTERTFLFTDIVRSTDLVAAIGDDAWVTLRAWHDRALRSLFAASGGEEVDHSGDGFFVAFRSSSAAVTCAIEIQRILAEQRRVHGFAPSVRIGLHAAEAVRTSGSYAGRGVHEAARIAAQAGQDEIVASLDTAADARAKTIGDPTMASLKGLAGPMALVRIDWRRT
jgi:class 3 adenylate cyclase/tetratricopeptide (TPR) repeat protein